MKNKKRHCNVNFLYFEKKKVYIQYKLEIIVSLHWLLHPLTLNCKNVNSEFALNKYNLNFGF